MGLFKDFIYGKEPEYKSALLAPISESFGNYSDFTTTFTNSFQHHSFQDVGYKNSAFLSLAMRLSLAFSEAPLRVFIKGEKKDEHPLRKILANPVSRKLIGTSYLPMSEKQFQIIKKFYQILTGTCYVYKIRNDRGQIIGLYPYSGVALVLKRDENTGEFYYETSRFKRIEKRDIIACNWVLPNPENMRLGYAPLAQLERDLAIDAELTQFVYNFLKNDAMPGVMYTTNLSLTDPQREAMKATIQSRYGGSNKGIPLVGDNGLDAKRVGSYLDELDSTNLRKNHESRICAAFGVPVEISGLQTGVENSAYANGQNGSRRFVEQIVMQHWTLDADEMENGLAEELGDSEAENFSLHHDLSYIQSLAENEDAKFTRYINAFKEGVVTLNEARVPLGLEKLPDGDTFKTAPQPLAIDTEQTEDGKVLNISTANFKQLDDGFTEEKALAHFKKFDDPSQDATEVLKKKLEKPFDNLLKEVLKNVPDGKSFKDGDDERQENLFNEDKFTESLKDAIEPELKEYVPIVWGLTFADLAEDWQDYETDFSKRKDKVVEVSTKNIKESSATVKSELRELIRKNKDKTVPELSDIIKQKFQEYRDTRADLIAQTTVTLTTSISQEEVFEELGYDSRIVTQRDGKVRHPELDNQEPNEEGYFKTSDGSLGKYPGGFDDISHNIRCRCVRRAVKKKPKPKPKPKPKK